VRDHAKFVQRRRLTSEFPAQTHDVLRAATSSNPEGIPAISRALSEATPPEPRRNLSTPEMFSVNNQFREYWFFVADPKCPTQILQEVADRFAELLEPNT